MSKSFCLLVIFSFISAITCLKFPSEIEKCAYEDGKCITNQMNIAIKLFPKGNAQLNLVSLDPLELDFLEISQGGDSPINLNLTFKNAKIYGLAGSKAIEVSGFQENPHNAKHEARYTAPIYSLVGDYEAHGRVLVLPLEGIGKANLSMVNPDITYKCISKAVEKNGEIYAEIGKSTYVYNNIERLEMRLDNLFNGQEALTDSINTFLNENWKEIFNELKPKIGEAFGEMTTQVINNVFNKRPYKDFFKSN